MKQRLHPIPDLRRHAPRLVYLLLFLLLLTPWAAGQAHQQADALSLTTGKNQPLRDRRGQP